MRSVLPLYLNQTKTREGNGTPLQYSCLENPMGRGAWWAAVHGVTKSWTQLSHFHFSLSCIGEGNGNPLQCSCLETPRDGGSWWAAVYGVAQSWTWLRDWTELNWLNLVILQKAMAPHSSTLAWKIPWAEEPGRLPFMGSHRVRHDWSDLA